MKRFRASNRVNLGEIKARITGGSPSLSRTVISHVPAGSHFNPPSGRILFQRARLEDVDFRGTWWDHLGREQATFIACDFRGARFGHAVLGQVRGQTIFRRCRFDEADLLNVHPGAARFVGCTFDGARLEDWRAFLAEFVDCHFRGRLARMIFSGRPWGPGADELEPPRVVNEFRGNDFRSADLIDCSFVHGVDVAAQLWPTDGAYIRLDRAQERIDRAKEIVSRWTDQVAREHALRMLYVYSSGGFEEQAEIFSRRDDLSSMPTDVSDQVWRILEEVP